MSTDNANELEAPEVVETPVVETPEVEAKPEGETEKQVDKPEGEQPKAKNNLDKRFHKLTTTIKQQQQQIAELMKAKPSEAPAIAGKPDIANYTDQGKYLEDVAVWAAESAVSKRDEKQTHQSVQQQQAKIEIDWGKKTEQAAEKYDDFQDVIDSVDPSLVFHGAVATAIKKSDVGADVLYHISNTPGLAEKIAAMDPVDAIRQIGKLEAKFETQKPAPQKVSAAPKPMTPVGSKATAVESDPEKMSPKAFAEMRNKQIAERRR